MKCSKKEIKSYISINIIIELIQGHKSKDMIFTYQGTLSYDVQDKEHEKVINFK